MSEIKVAEQTWSSLSPEQQDKVTEIFRSTNLLKEGDSLKADPSIAATGSNPACETACSVAEAAAVAACNALPPPASWVCVAAAHAAGNYCRSRC
jgi:hypothetical protein